MGENGDSAEDGGGEEWRACMEWDQDVEEEAQRRQKEKEEERHKGEEAGMEGEGDTEEAAEVKIRRSPGEPTSREREEHEATHIPYRDWCRRCVRARGVNHTHGKREKGKQTRRRH